MKISMKDRKNYTELCYIESGDIFRPANSLSVYLKLYNTIDDDCWNECDSRLYPYYENPQDQDLVNGIEDAIPCVDMVTGEIVFYHKDLKVVKLNYLLEVEE